jgi:hypothetical protein
LRKARDGTLTHLDFPDPPGNPAVHTYREEGVEIDGHFSGLKTLTALKGVMLDKGALDRVQLSVLGEAFDGVTFFPVTE